jgi:hypothetical protein
VKPGGDRTVDRSFDRPMDIITIMNPCYMNP